MALTDNQVTDVFKTNFGRAPGPDELTKFQGTDLTKLSTMPDPTYALVPGASGGASTVYNKTTGKAYTSPQEFASAVGADPNSLDWSKYKFDTTYQPTQQPYSEQPVEDPAKTPFDATKAYNDSFTQLGGDAAKTAYTTAQSQINDIDSQIESLTQQKLNESHAAGGSISEAQLREEVANENQHLLLQKSTLTRQLQTSQAAYNNVIKNAQTQAQLAEKTYQEKIAAYNASTRNSFNLANLAERTNNQAGSLDIKAVTAGIDPSTIPGTGSTSGGGSSKITATSSLGDFFSIYAPKGDGKNDPVAYTNAVAAQLGIDPSTPITALAGKETDLATAIATHEGYFSGASKVAVANNNPGNLIYAGQAGATQSGRWAKFATASAGMQALVNDIHAKISKAYGLTPADYKIAQDISTGKYPLKDLNQLISNRGANTNLKKSLYELATTLNPYFDQTKFEQGQKYGGSADTQKTLALIDTAKQTLTLLKGYSDQAQRSNIPLINKFKMPGQVALGNVSISNFGEAQKLLSDELANVFGGGAASDMKLQLGFDLTDTNLSPAQFNSAVDFLNNRIQGREDSIQKQIWQGVGPDATSSGSADTFDAKTYQSKYNY